MSVPKRHHYIPQALIRNFQYDDAKVHFFDRNDPKAGIQERTPRSIFWEKHLYSVWHDDGRRDTHMETKFANSIDNKIRDFFTRRLILSYTKLLYGPFLEEKMFFSRLVFNIMQRNPAFHLWLKQQRNFQITARGMANDYDPEQRSKGWLRNDIWSEDPLDERQMA